MGTTISMIADNVLSHLARDPFESSNSKATLCSISFTTMPSALSPRQRATRSQKSTHYTPLPIPTSRNLKSPKHQRTNQAISKQPTRTALSVQNIQWSRLQRKSSPSKSSTPKSAPKPKTLRGARKTPWRNLKSLARRRSQIRRSLRSCSMRWSPCSCHMSCRCRE